MPNDLIFSLACLVLFGIIIGLSIKRRLTLFDSLLRPNIDALKQKHDVAALVKALERKDFRIRLDAAKALAALGDRRGLDYLIFLLRDSRGASRKLVEVTLIQIGEPAVEPLIAVLSIKPPLDGKWQHFIGLASAATVLGQIDDQRAVEPLIMVLHSRRIVPDDHPLRSAVIRALGRIGDTRALPELIAALKETGTINKDAQAALLLFGEAAIEPLVDVLNDSHRHSAQSAAELLESLGWRPKGADQRLLFLFLRGRYDEMAAEPKGIEFLARELKPTTFTIYEQARYSNDERLAEALADRGDSRGVGWLISQMEQHAFARSASDTLTRIMRAGIERLTSEDLQAILDLPEVSQFYRRKYHKDITDDPNDNEFEEYYLPVDCSQMKELARRELTRREMQG